MMRFASCSNCLPKRYWVIILAFIGNFLLLFLQLNMSIAIVEMTSEKNATVGNKTELIRADYPWNSMEKGVIMSAFFFGYSFAFAGGFMINKFGGVTVFGVTLALTAILTALSPLFLHIHLHIFIIGRALQGLFGGFATSSMADVYAHWSPMSERARLVSFAAIGKTVSPIVNYPASGFLAFTFGWAGMFYISGIITLIWCIIWLIFVSNDPADDKFISDKEKCYLKKNIPFISNQRVAIPLKSMLSSVPIWALFNEFFTIAWASSFVYYYLPLYIKDVHNVNTRDVGLISAIPLLCGGITRPLAACLADYLRSGVYSISKVHKLYIFWGEVFVLITMFAAAINGDFLFSIVCFCLLQIAFSFANTSYELIHMDVAGQFAGVTRSFSISWYSLGTFLNPLVMGYMVPHKTQTEWNYYFLLLCIISVYGVVIFVLFGSGDLQPWAILPKREEMKIENEIYSPNQAANPVFINDS